MKKIKLVGLGIFFSLLTACSGVGFVYKNLDWVAPWYLDDYIDMTDEQRREFDLAFGQVLQWHKKEELENYRRFLADVEKRIDSPSYEITNQDIEDFTDFTRNAWKRVRQQLFEKVVPLSVMVTKEQRLNLVEKITERQTELEERYLERTGEEYREESQQNMQESLETWLGPLTKDQKQLIKETVARLVRTDKYWMAEREKRNAAFIKLLKSDQVITADKLMPFFENRDEYETAEQQQLEDTNQSLIRIASLSVLNSRTERQHQHLADELAVWKGRFADWQQES